MRGKVHGILVCNNDRYSGNKTLTRLMHDNDIGLNMEYWSELVASNKKQRDHIRLLLKGWDGCDFGIIRYRGGRFIRCACNDCFPSSPLYVNHTDYWPKRD